MATPLIGKLRGADERANGAAVFEDDRPRENRWPVDVKYVQFERSGWEVTVAMTGG